ncbi:GDSL esterase/lipase [Dichanthelium oligosanthes]|uniref:GDSL esterase/lipase n=1 Tax=Dichanthelium oligosanthes TaxID=888268 RepID=A0A1E5WMP2_9POAL|nr:GDSL esterase/lipase [Dichanthelium oligosanthes]
MGCKLPMDGHDLVLCLLLVILSMQVLQVPVVASLRPPAMYVFGDSTLDVGNNNYLPGKNVARANRSHYGIDFPGIPTGRFSNGYNTADYVAKSMGFVSSPPPYLSLLASPSSSLLVLTALTTGVSYASGDAGILDSAVQYFKTTKANMVSTLGSRAVNAMLSRSIFLIGVGSNDMFVFAVTQQAQNRSAAEQQSDVAAFYAGLVSNYSATVTELYKLGARKFAIINVGLVGCVPRVRVLDPAGACADGMNQLAAGFDGALKSLLAGLAPKLPGMVYSLADSFGLTQATFAHPEASGYTNIAGACCGGGRMDAEADCLPESTLCANRGHYLFWDWVHPSQRAAMLSAKAFYDGPPQFTSPISFKQLAHKI